MAYTVINFKTKKALKEAVKNWNEFENHRINLGDGFEASSTDKKPIRAYQSGFGPDLSNYTGRVYLEGPHYPAAHTWYAACEMKDGVVIKVK